MNKIDTDAIINKSQASIVVDSEYSINFLLFDN